MVCKCNSGTRRLAKNSQMKFQQVQIKICQKLSNLCSIFTFSGKFDHKFSYAFAAKYMKKGFKKVD